MSRRYRRQKDIACYGFVAVACLVLFAVPAFSQGDTYQNEEFGFHITGPGGWIQTKGKPGQKYLVKYTQAVQEALPTTIGVTRDDIANHPEIKTPLEFSETVLSIWQSKTSIRIIEPPRAIILASLTGSLFTFEQARAQRGTGELTIARTSYYQFLKNRKVLSVVVVLNAQNVERDQLAIQTCIQSVKFLGE